MRKEEKKRREGRRENGGRRVGENRGESTGRQGMRGETGRRGGGGAEEMLSWLETGGGAMAGAHIADGEGSEAGPQ